MNKSLSELYKRIKKSLLYIKLSFKVIFKNQKWKIFLWILILVFPPLFTLFDNLIYSKLINNIANIVTKGNTFSPVLISFSLLILIRVLIAIVSKVKMIVFDKVAREVDGEMMEYTIKRTSNLSQINFDVATKYDKVKDAIGTELSLWNINWQIVSVATSLLSIIGALIILSKHKIYIAILSFVFLAPVVIIDVILINHDKKASVIKRRHSHVVQYFSGLLSNPLNMKEIILFNSYERIFKKWESHFKNNIRDRALFDFKRSMLVVVQKIFEILFFILIFCVCSIDVVKGEISLGDFYLFTANYTLVYASFYSIFESFCQIIENSEEYDVFLNFSKATSLGEREGQKLVEPKDVYIRFENVSFKYDDAYVLKNVSFEIHPREKIAIIGHNGSGKSTLIKLICGLYECEEGEIFINDANVKEYSQEDIYKLFGVVYQDFCHYQLSLRDVVASQNINDKNNSEKINRSLEKAGILEIADKLKKGLDTQLGKEFFEDGIELSGGQWQKLAISRNYFGDRKCYIFDEPASALDSFKEDELLRNTIQNLEMNDKNVIIISHRLSVGKMVDKILFFENGILLEQGTHEELMQKKQKYADMFSAQASLYIRGEHEKNFKD